MILIAATKWKDRNEEINNWNKNDVCLLWQNQQWSQTIEVEKVLLIC